MFCFFKHLHIEELRLAETEQEHKIPLFNLPHMRYRYIPGIFERRSFLEDGRRRRAGLWTCDLREGLVFQDVGGRN